MSVTQNTYVVIGVMYAWKDLTEEQIDFLEPYRDTAREPLRTHEGLVALIDGMNGEYVVVGVPLAKSEQDQGLSKPVDVCPGPNIVLEAMELVQGKLDGHLPPGNFSIWALTHYR